MPCKEKDGHHGAWACLAPCSSQRSVANHRKRKAVWSSLPELLVWMIKDKLDIFENFAFAAVCRDWRSASARYPKALDSVGDGMPWFWHICEGEEEDICGCTREIISFDGNRKFKIKKMPEISTASTRFSKQGWILLQERLDSMSRDLCRLFIINLFTSVKIELPDLEGTDGRHQGSFTIKDGFPHRVHLVTVEDKFTVSIRTACCGEDQVWTLQTYCNVHTYYRRPVEVVSIGQKVYVLDGDSKMTVFDVVEQSSKELPPLPGCGFIAEHDDGQLIYIERRLTQSFDIVFDFSSFSVYRYNDDDAGSWERLDMKSAAAAVTNTCWFTGGYHACIAAKGQGLNVYDLCTHSPVADNPYEEHCYVVVYDLIAGTAQKQSIPFQVQRGGLMWIAIG